MRELARNLHFELVPMKSIEEAIEALPPDADVSVTCSPVEGHRRHAGIHRALAHARPPADAAHRRSARREPGTRQADRGLAARAAPLRGVRDRRRRHRTGRPVRGSAAVHARSARRRPGCHRLGFAGYPDGHAFIDAAELTDQMHAKQSLLAEAGVDGWISTQMCFDADRDPRVADGTARGGPHPADPARHPRRGRPHAADDDGRPARASARRCDTCRRTDRR